MSLNLRERTIILFATAPEGFEMTPRELTRKFNVSVNSMQAALSSLVTKEILQRRRCKQKFYPYAYSAGKALKEELGEGE